MAETLPPASTGAGACSDRGLILTPAVPGSALKDFGTTGSPVFCGVPAVTLPLLESHGMPMGVHVVGPRGDDGRLLRGARWLVRHVQEAG